MAVHNEQQIPFMKHLDLGIHQTGYRPDFHWRGARLLDFGCDEAITALGFATRRNVKSIVGVNIMPDVWRCLERAKSNIPIVVLPGNLQLHRVTPGQLHSDADRFDLIYSCRLSSTLTSGCWPRQSNYLSASWRRAATYSSRRAPCSDRSAR